MEQKTNCIPAGESHILALQLISASATELVENIWKEQFCCRLETLCPVARQTVEARCLDQTVFSSNLQFKVTYTVTKMY